MTAKSNERSSAPAEASELREAAVSARPVLGSAASEALVFNVGPEEAGERLDRFLSGHAATLPQGFSRTRLKALIQAGEVRVDNNVVLDPARRLAASERVDLAVPSPQESSLLGEDLPLDVVYEDEHLIVIDKPAGLVVHPAPGHEAGTLVNALLRRCGASLSGVGGVRRPGIVHRLDKDTSGLMVVAKTDRAHQGLAQAFADHGRSGSLDRQYLALVWGSVGVASGKVDAPIGRHPQRRERMAVVSEERGRRAVTHWRLEEALGATSLVRCRLETGRTHQIRVHMASNGHPLVGDSAYGAGFKTKALLLPEAARAALSGLGRQALHAAVLGFEHPISGEKLRFESKLPEDFIRLIKALRQSRKDEEVGLQRRA